MHMSGLKNQETVKFLSVLSAAKKDTHAVAGALQTGGPLQPDETGQVPDRLSGECSENISCADLQTLHKLFSCLKDIDNSYLVLVLLLCKTYFSENNPLLFILFDEFSSSYCARCSSSFADLEMIFFEI
ncbi:hypothetical protein TREES_T100018601 [Tupaia chinensis]|uniref:Uncharacterized protein n=1 Tax=Tupaia chinensis TaxID=246437 RepID=L9KQ68_TUPCH|nr:hypothetical protein TREES_T100018601 [Tupaia chinensis]